MILCVAANPSIDKLFEVQRLSPGAIHRPIGFVQVPGGKGLNVARAAVALGAEVTVAAMLAGHAGRWVEEALGSAGVGFQILWAAGETRSSLSVADRETTSLTEFYEAGGPIGPEDWASFEWLVGSLLPGAAWMTLSGSLPSGAPNDGYARLITAARDAGALSALDAEGAALAAALSASPDLVKVNGAEARSVLGLAGENGEEMVSEDVRAMAVELRHRIGGDGHAAAVTFGVDGAALAGPDGSVWLGAATPRGPYPVGSGDAFLAGMVCELERGVPWPSAFAAGLGAAGANAELAGAGRLVPDRAAALARSASVQRS